jgi:acetoin utilization deacetylase AcuC-like enzyme
MQIFYSKHHVLHNPQGIDIDGCPFVTEEIPERFDSILSGIQESQIGEIHEASDNGLAPILNVHDAGYLHYLQHAYQDNTTYYGKEKPVVPETFAIRTARRKPQSFFGKKGYYGFGIGSPIVEGTWEAAYWSAQCALSAANAVKKGAAASYALCRPPGHHAGADFYGGFCYLNNAAIAARALDGKIAILDIDYHHGNGTQEIFYADPNVLFCSLHAHPDDDYPFYWGSKEESGEAKGLGYNFNWPLPQGIRDLDYLQVLHEALEFILEYRANYLVISAGFDILEGDPSGGFLITIDGLAEIGKRIAALPIPTVIIQEGGYKIDKLGICAANFLIPFRDKQILTT